MTRTRVPRQLRDAEEDGERSPEVGSEGILIQVASQPRIIKIAVRRTELQDTGHEVICCQRGRARVEPSVSQQRASGFGNARNDHKRKNPLLTRMLLLAFK